VKEDATEIIQAAYRHFVAGGNEQESPEDQARAVIDWILERERGRHRVGDDPVAAYKVDRLTLHKMRTWDSDDPGMSTLEKAFRKLAVGEGADAIALIRNQIAFRSKKMGSVASKRWEERAERKKRAPTPLDRFNDLLEQIVREKPDITSGQLQQKIERLQGGDLVECVTEEGEIRLKGYEGRHPKLAGIPNKLTRIKKKIS
jgi:hypothetical protein